MKKLFTSTLILVLCGFNSWAAITAPSTINLPGIPPFTFLQNVLAELNANGVSGSGTITINCGLDETAPSGGFILGSAKLNADIAATGISIVINGKNHIFTAASGTGNHDALFTIQGADNITLDGFNFRESAANTTATSMMEHGISIVKLNASDGCKSVNIQNCEIILNKGNTTAATGVSHYGSAGIFIGNCTYASTAALSPSVETGTHDNIFMLKDTITNVNEGCWFYGNPVAADGSAFNDKNTNFQQGVIANFTHEGVYISYFSNDFVVKNIISNLDSGGTAPTANSIAGVRYVNPNTALQTNTNWSCNNNDIRLTINTPSSTSYYAAGVITQVYGTGTTEIKDNTIQLKSTGVSAMLLGVYSQNNLGTLTVSTNTLQNFETATTNVQSVIGIFSGGYSTFTGIGLANLSLFQTTTNISKNTIQSFKATCGATGLTPPNRVAGIIFDNLLTTAPLSITDNTIKDIELNATCIRFIGCGSIYSTGPYTTTPSPYAHTTTFSGNTFDNIFTSGTANSSVIFLVQPLGVYPNANTFNASKNKYSKISSDLGLAAVHCSDYCLAYNVNRDTISGITSANWQAVGLINNINSTNYGSKSVSVTNTSITNITSNATSGGASVAGIQLQPGGNNLLTDATITNCKIAGVTTSDPTASAVGINVTGGAAGLNINTNMISDVYATSNTTSYSSSFGILMNNVGTNNVLYNTINLVTAPAGGTGFGATGLAYQSGGTNKIQNNIIRVNAVAGTGNNVTAVRGLVGSASSAPSTSGFAAASNIYWTPSGSNNYLYVEGTTNTSLVNGFAQSGLTPSTTKNIQNDTFFNSTCNRSSYHKFMQTGAPTREVNTATEDNLTGSSGIYAPTGMSYAEGTAVDNSIILDFATISRPFGSSDIGALEFAGTTIPQIKITIATSTGLDTACPANLPTLTSTIPAYFSHVSYQWNFNGTDIPGARSSSVLARPTTGSYILKVYDSVTGCTYPSDAFKITIVPPPPAMITYYDTLNFCETGAVVLNANHGYAYTYRWKKNGSFLPGETNDHLVVTTSGTWEVEVNTPLGCESLSTSVVTRVFPLPDPEIYWVRDRVLGVTQKFYTYQWYRNNVKIDSDAIGPLYYTLDDGAYTVEVTDSNGCSSKSDVFLYSLGLKENALAEAVRVYPNPVSDVLQISSPAAINVSVNDITGRVLQTIKNAKTVNMGTYAPGMYLLNITDEQGKLIKVEKVRKAE